MTSSKNVIEKTRKEIEKDINQGDCVYLKNQDELFQVRFWMLSWFRFEKKFKLKFLFVLLYN